MYIYLSTVCLYPGVAVQLARQIEDLDISWFEEPVCPEDEEGYRRLRAATSIPIAGGESTYTRSGGLVDMATPC